jgi:RNA polymerase sigma-70 factor (ECF subfamily)
MIITPESCKDLNDNEIVAKSLENLDYFSCLYQRYEPELLRYVRRITGMGEEEAQDVLQDSFVKIWRNLNEFDNSLKLSSWIYRIVHNEAVSFIRKKQSFGKDRKVRADDYHDIIMDDPDLEIDPAEKATLIHELLDQISLKYREVLILKFFESKSYEEISDILRIPEGTVAIRINRAKKILKEMAAGRQL